MRRMIVVWLFLIVLCLCAQQFDLFRSGGFSQTESLSE